MVAADAGGPPLSNIIASSAVSGFISRLFFHPIDTIKTRIQSQNGRFDSSVLRLRGIYDGIGIALFGSIPGVALYLSVYQLATKAPALASMNSDLRSLLAGFAAEAVSCVLWVPIDVIKERLQASVLPTRSSLEALRYTMEKEGLRGVYRGYGSTLVSFGPYSGIYFVAYERFKAALAVPPSPSRGGQGDGPSPITLSGTSGTSPITKQGEVAAGGATVDLPFSRRILASSAAGTVAAVTTSPLDFIKVRLQIQRRLLAEAADCAARSSGQGAVEVPYAYRHLLDGIQHVVRQYGVRGLFRGAAARVIFVAPSTAMTVAVAEQFQSMLQKAT